MGTGGGGEQKTPSTREEGKRWGVCSHHRDGHRLPALFFQRPNAGGDGKNRPPRSETPTPRTLTTGPSAHGVSEPRLLGKEKGRMRGADVPALFVLTPILPAPIPLRFARIRILTCRSCSRFHARLRAARPPPAAAVARRLRPSQPV